MDTITHQRIVLRAQTLAISILAESSTIGEDAMVLIVAADLIMNFLVEHQKLPPDALDHIFEHCRAIGDDEFDKFLLYKRDHR